MCNLDPDGLLEWHFACYFVHPNYLGMFAPAVLIYAVMYFLRTRGFLRSEVLSPGVISLTLYPSIIVHGVSYENLARNGLVIPQWDHLLFQVILFHPLYALSIMLILHLVEITKGTEIISISTKLALISVMIFWTLVWAWLLFFFAS